jgi:RNA polymerase sigma-70 factor (ECF subfamily)
MKDADFRAFVKGERQRLIHYVRSLFKETADMDAEDVVHDVLVKILERPDSTAPLDNVTGYVYRAAKNRVIDFVRTRKSMVSLEGDPDGEGQGLIGLLHDLNPNAFELLQTQQGERALFEALSKLSEIERQVVIAHEFEGISFRELSSSLKIPQNTLLSHKARALKKLKEHFLNSK